MRLRSIAPLVVVIGLLAPAAVGAERPARRQVLTYDSPWGTRYSHWWDGYLESLPERAPLTFHPRHGDRSVRLDLAPSDGRTAFVHIRQGRGREATARYFCGRRTWLDLAGRGPVEVRVYVGACENHLFSTATSGTVTAVFSRSATGGSIRGDTHNHP